MAAQNVQRSAYPDAYAEWEPAARRLSAALEGARATTVTCTPEVQPVAARTPRGAWTPEEMGPDGLTPRTRYLRDLIKSGFGETNLGGWCPGGCTTGHVEGSDHYTGHAIDVMILPHTDPSRFATEIASPPGPSPPARHQVRHLARPHLDTRRRMASLHTPVRV